MPLGIALRARGTRAYRVSSTTPTVRLQGSHSTSIAFGERCRKAGVRPSMGSVGDCYDNSMAESFFATLECELLDRKRFATPAEAKRAVFAFIEGWYNPHRRHSAICYASPIQFERQHAAASG